MAEASSKRRSTRQAQSRKRSLYVDPETDDEFAGADGDEHHPLQQAKRLKTGRISRPSSSEELEDRTTAREATQPVPAKTKAPPAPRRKQTRSQASSSTSQRPRKTAKKASGHAKKAASTSHAVVQRLDPDAITHSAASDGNIPKWSTLPFAIWIDIFTHASQPGNKYWLLRSACKVSRDFAEAAMTVFYREPSLPSANAIVSFDWRIELGQSKGRFKYNSKVRRLCLDVRELSRAFRFSESMQIADMAARLPQLAELFFTDPSDSPPFRTYNVPRWRYSEKLFERVESSGTRIKGWRWNWSFIPSVKQAPPRAACDYIGEIHRMAAWQSIEHLEIASFPPLMMLVTNQLRANLPFGETIGCLKNLKSLSLESSELFLQPSGSPASQPSISSERRYGEVVKTFMHDLPRTLEKLKIANDAYLTSDDLLLYLTKDGSCRLKELVLDYNPHLDLAFLPALKTTCPELQVLRMDMHYYSQRHTVSEIDPKYDQLLKQGQVPTWPSTLQSLELVHLQRLDADGAKSLFSSLVDAAEELPDLRNLMLHAHISISWRDRAAFRDEWIERLRHVFLRQSTNPDPHLMSFKTFRRLRQNEADAKLAGQVASPTGRLLSHVSLGRAESKIEDGTRQDSQQEPGSKRRSKRVMESRISDLSGTESNAPSPGAASDDMSTTSERPDAETYIQGMCNVVDIRIDNQRPREEQFNESHFLDSEASGDEDWNEGDEMPEEDYAW